MQRGGRGFTMVISVALALFMVLVLGSTVLAAAEPAPAAGTTSGAWAYGFLKTFSVGPRTASDGWTYEGNATIGYSVVLNQTNSTTNLSDFELSVHRAMGVRFTVDFCTPSCASPVSYWDLSYAAWETVSSFANFTRDGQVVVTGSSAPATAIALLNSSSSLEANLTETGHSNLPGASGPAERSKYLSAEVSSTSAVSLGSPLGLIPVNLSPGESWSSSSSFNASGSTSYRYYYHFVGPVVTETVGPVVGSWVVSPSGSVAVSGEYAPGQTTNFGGVTYPALQLNYTIVGGLAVREGFILIPDQSDIFDSSNAPWSANQSGSSTVQLAALDVVPFANGHLGIAASKLAVDSGSTNPADVGGTASSLTPAVATSNPVSVETVQGTPESAPQAESTDACLTSGANCPAVSPAPALKPLLGPIVLATVVVAVAALIALVLVAERRRVPPPPYPNAALYPPVVAGSAAPRPPPTPPPTDEEDPLDHLW